MVSLGVFYCNVRSLLPKVNTLQHYVSLYQPSIVALTETWLESTIPSSLFCPENYTVYRWDRSGRRGGGVLILVINTLVSGSLEVALRPLGDETFSRIEVIACKITLENGNHLGVLCLYRPPDSVAFDDECMMSHIRDFLNYQLDYNVIVGDFNFPDISWPSNASSSSGRAFLNFCQDNFLEQCVSSSTRLASKAILDLVLATQGTSISELSVGEEFGSSDHSIIYFNISVKHTCITKRMYARNLKRANWSEFSKLMEPSEDWYAALSSGNVDTVWNMFISEINSALDCVAPIRSFSTRNFISSSKIRTALRYKRRFYRALSRNPSSVRDRMLYERSKFIAQKLIDEDLRHREERIIETPDPRIFWAYVNRRMSSNLSIRQINSSGSNILNPGDIADVFNQYFASQYQIASSDFSMRNLNF